MHALAVIRPDPHPAVQLVRVFDVVVLGPLMIAAAVRSDLPLALRWVLGVSGGLTIFFNGVNFVVAARRG